MATADQLNRARSFLRKAEEYLSSAEANLVAQRFTAASGDAVHAGISAKDAVACALAGSTTKARDHSAASRELRQVLTPRPGAPAAEKALRELLQAKSTIEYSPDLATLSTADPLVRRARMLVDLAVGVVRLGG